MSCSWKVLGVSSECSGDFGEGSASVEHSGGSSFIGEAYIPGKGAEVGENRFRDAWLICMEELFCDTLSSSSSFVDAPPRGIYFCQSVKQWWFERLLWGSTFPIQVVGTMNEKMLQLVEMSLGVSLFRQKFAPFGYPRRRRRINLLLQCQRSNVK